HLTLKAEVATTLLALALVYLLGASYGGMAAALALLLRMLLITPLQVRGLHAAIGYDWRSFFQSSYRSLLASVVMVVVVMWLSRQTGLSGYAHLAGDIAIGTLTYALAYSLLHPRWPQEFKLVFTAR
ncbi:polysaccharide biosynthesis protein, partial [Pseudomonas fluorescens]